MRIPKAIEQCLRRQGVSGSDGSMVVAFSGGPDSMALLHALAAIAHDVGLELHAAHLDHAIDEDSRARCERAAELAERVGVECTTARISAVSERHPGESIEAAARRVRYEFLADCADRVGAAWIATAHHADDQRETVLLRLLFGSGVAGLSGIPARRGRILRPLLTVGRSDIEEYLAPLDIEPIEDPTNLHLSVPRNLVRHRLLPALRSRDPEIDERLISLASAAGAAVESLDRRLLGLLEPCPESGGLLLSRRSLVALPSVVRQYAVGAVCRAAGAPPPASASLVELDRQIDRQAGIGCDLGSSWRIEDRGPDLVISPRPSSPQPFAYTLEVPGEVRLPELALVFRLTRRPVESWMFRGSRRRAGMSLPLSAGQHVTIRNRRPGDRLQPLGCDYRKRLKDVLIDRKVPREVRDRLPLLCVGNQVVWVPGVTIDEKFRLRRASHAWVAEIEDDREHES